MHTRRGGPRARAVGTVVVAMLLATSVAAPAIAQLGTGDHGARVELTEPGRSASIPFESFRRWIVLEATVNGAGPLRFIVDSGAPIAVLADADQAQRLSLRIVGRAEVEGIGQDARSTVPIAGNLEIGLPGARISRALAAIGVAGEALAGVDGVIGHPLFSDLVVEIFWQERRLLLHDPERFVYRGDGAVLPLRRTRTGHLAIGARAATAGPPVDVELVVDTGAGHALSLDPDVPGLPPPGRLLPGVVIGWGSRGVARGALGRIRVLEIGGQRLAEVVTSFPDDAPWGRLGQRGETTLDGNLGLRVLRRFHVIFDAPHGRLILEPRPGLAAPFAFDSSGLSLAPWAPGQDALEVADVIAGSPAAEAGLRSGDRLLSLDGIPAARISSELLEERLWGRPGHRVEVQAVRDGRRFSVFLTLRELL